MGIERYPMKTISCDCGKGSYVINSCSYDGYDPKNRSWYEAKIECLECYKKYAIVQDEKRFILVHSDDKKIPHDVLRTIYVITD